MLKLNKKLSTQEKGFSLLEIIISLAILSVAFFGLVKVFPMGISMNSASRDKTTASYLAQDKIEKLFARGYDQIATGTIETKQRISNNSDSYLYNYQRKTEVNYIDGDLNPTSSDSGMKRINTTVYYSGGVDKKEQSFEVNTIISKN